MLAKSSLLKLGRLTLIVLVFTAVFLKYFSQVESHNLAADEHEYIRKSEYFDLFFLKRDFTHPAWKHLDAYDQTKLGEYFYGLAQYLAGFKDIQKAQKEAAFNQGWVRSTDAYSQLWKPDKWWIRLSGKPLKTVQGISPEAFKMILAGRYLAVVFGLLTLGVCFWVMRELTNWFWSLLTVIFIASHPLFYQSAFEAIGDIILLFFLTLGLLLAIFWQRALFSGNRRLFIFLTIGVGINSALAWAAKLNGFMNLIFFNVLLGVIYLLLIFFKKRKFSGQLMRLGFAALIVNALAGFIFYILHPYLWRNFFKGLIQMTQWRIWITARFRLNETYNIGSFSDKIMIIYRAIFFENWLLLLLFLIGFGLLGWQAAKGLKKREFKTEMTIIVHGLVTWLLVLAYVVVNFERYFLPVLPLVIIYQVLGGWELWRLFKNHSLFVKIRSKVFDFYKD